MQKRYIGNTEVPVTEIKVQFPPINELIERAERITESCILPDQVIVGRNFLLNIARRGTQMRQYSEHDLEMLHVLVDHMANRKAARLFSKEVDTTLN
jgi:hypothetical protein